MVDLPAGADLVVAVLARGSDDAQEGTQVKKYSRIPLLIAAAAIGTMALATAGPATAGQSSSTGGAATTGYNAIPSKVSGNVSSLSFEGDSSRPEEFGDKVALGGKGRSLQSVSVLLSSWGCQTGNYYADGNCQTTPGATFTMEMRFKIYDESGTTVLANKLATLTVPYRPSASPQQCTGADAGKWYNSKDRTCYNGFPHLATVDMAELGVTLPQNVIWTVQYRTTSGARDPLGTTAELCSTLIAGCGYDTVNIGTFTYPNSPYAGTDLNEDEAFFNGSMQSGWTGHRPLGAIATR